MIVQSSNVLVTGMSGTIGLEVARLFSNRHWVVRGVTRSSGELADLASLAASLPQVDLLIGDVADVSGIEAAVASSTAIVHLAGSSGVTASFDDPLRDLSRNAAPFLRILQAAAPQTKVVLMSSQLVYGSGGPGSPYTETQELDPRSPYAAHRALLETYARIYASRNDLDVTVIRLGNVFGSTYNLSRKRAHGVVPRMLGDLTEHGAVKVYGTGSQLLGLLHARDCAEAIAAVVEEPSVGGRVQVFNVAGEELSVESVADTLVRGFGTGEVIRVPWPQDGLAMARDVHMDDVRFREAYGWMPRRSVTEALTSVARQAADAIKRAS